MVLAVAWEDARCGRASVGDAEARARAQWQEAQCRGRFRGCRVLRLKGAMHGTGADGNDGGGCAVAEARGKQRRRLCRSRGEQGRRLRWVWRREVECFARQG
jgi:hypothetical protein